MGSTTTDGYHGERHLLRVSTHRSHQPVKGGGGTTLQLVRMNRLAGLHYVRCKPSALHPSH